MTDVSFVLAARDPHLPWLSEALDAIAKEPGIVSEVVLVDDGSRTPLTEILLEGVPSGRLIRQPPRGVSASRNVGLGAARGATVRFVDADDVITPGSTRALFDASRRADLIAYGGTEWCDAELNPMWRSIPSKSGDIALEYLLCRLPIMLPSMLFPHAVAEAAAPWDERLKVSEDYDYICRALELRGAVATRVLATHYRRHGPSASADQDSDVVGIAATVAGYVRRHPELSVRRRRQLSAMQTMLEAERISGYKPWLEMGFWRAIARDPGTVRMAWARAIQPRLSARQLRAQGATARTPTVTG